MLIRREFIVMGCAASLLPAAECSAVGLPVVRPEDFGARGDGITDDTRAFQLCLDLAPPKAVVRLRPGAVYRIDTNVRPTFGATGGIKLRDNQTLQLNGAELKALASNQPGGSVVQAYMTHGWSIEGPGRVTGERDIHKGTAGEWGMGISAWSASNWRIHGGVEISNCWGDGIYLGSAPVVNASCENFLIDAPVVHDCRRNGISVVSGRNGEIRSPNIERIDGTLPRGGIDLEPDSPLYPNRNIRIRGGRIRDVAVGVYVTVANDQILITGMDIEGQNSGIIIGDGANGVRIEANPNIKSLNGGEEGGAIRTVANPETVKGLHILGNQLSGGGGFVVDIVGGGYRDLIVSRNRIFASNRGVQGIARIGAGTFTDNDCLLGPGTGRANDYFIHLQTVAYGRNIYRNRSAYSMYSAIRGGRDLGGDRFEGPRLRYYSEPL